MINFALRLGDVVAKLPEEEVDITFNKVIDITCKKLALSLTKDIIINSKQYTEYIDLAYQKLEIERINYWVPIYRKLGIPHIFGYNLSPDFNADLFMVLELRDYLEIPEAYMMGVEKLKNINDNKPMDGTIIGILTDEELQTVIEQQIKETALETLSLQCSSIAEMDQFLAKVESIIRLKYDVWVPITKRLNASWGWDLRCDTATGEVYVVNYDREYIPEKAEEDYNENDVNESE